MKDIKNKKLNIINKVYYLNSIVLEDFIWEWCVRTWTGTWKRTALVGKTDSGKPNSNRRLHEVTKHALLGSEANPFQFVRIEKKEQGGRKGPYI